MSDQAIAFFLSLVEIFLVPIIIFVMQRHLGKKLDNFDEKREKAREERQQEKAQEKKWRESMTAGMQAMLRAELISEHRKTKKQEYASTTTKEYVEKIYTAYAKLGGNGLGKTMYEEIMNMPSENKNLD